MVKFIFTISLLFTGLSCYASDPTRPLIPTQSSVKKSTKAKPKTKQPLTAIFTRSNKRYAIIEDKIYHPGDRYRGSRIVAIHKDRVVLQTTKGKQQLTLIKNVKKKN